jgi:hypothetical protein
MSWSVRGSPRRESRQSGVRVNDASSMSAAGSCRSRCYVTNARYHGHSLARSKLLRVGCKPDLKTGDLQRQQPPAQGDRHGLGARAGAQLREYLADVELRGVLGDVQLRGDRPSSGRALAGGLGNKDINAAARAKSRSDTTTRARCTCGGHDARSPRRERCLSRKWSNDPGYEAGQDCGRSGSRPAPREPRYARSARTPAFCGRRP